MEKKYSIFLFAFVSALIFNQFAYSTPKPYILDEIIDPVYALRLEPNNAVITETQTGNSAFKYLPKNTELQKKVNDIKASLNPNIVVETLCLYKKPMSAKDVIWNEVLETAIFNKLTAISTLAGIQYYSESRKKMRTLYEKSYIIDSPSNKKKQPDPVFAVPPTVYNLYALQKDLTFGENVYNYRLEAFENILVYTVENLTALNAGIIPAIGKNKLQSIVAVINCGDSLLIYSVSMAKAASVPGMQDRINNSFKNRAQAIIKWLSAGLDGIFA